MAKVITAERIAAPQPVQRPADEPAEAPERTPLEALERTPLEALERTPLEALEHTLFDDVDAIVEVLDTRIEIDDDIDGPVAPAPEPHAAVGERPAAVPEAPEAPAVLPPPPTLQPAQPAPGQVVAARLDGARRGAIDRDVLPSGERFEDAFVRSLTEGPGVIR